MKKVPVLVLHSVHAWLRQTETFIYNQIRSLPESVKSYVVCRKLTNHGQFPLPEIHPLSRRPFLLRNWDRGLRTLRIRRHLQHVVRVAGETGAQILHSHFGNLGWENVPAARRAGMRHVVTFYGYDVNYLPRSNGIWRQRYQELFREADRVLCEGPHMARCVEALGCEREKIALNPLGVDVDRVPFVAREYSPAKPLRVLMAASFRQKKGIPYALMALGRLQRELRLEATLIGDSDGTLRSNREKRRILETIDRLHLGPVVRRLGYQPYSRFIEEMYSHHVFLAPSVTASDGDTEGGAPVALIEVAASGMPIISTRHCDIPFVLEDGVHALLTDEGDVDGLVECIHRLLGDPSLWNRLTTAARRRMEAVFDSRRSGENLARIYECLV